MKHQHQHHHHHHQHQQQNLFELERRFTVHRRHRLSYLERYSFNFTPPEYLVFCGVFGRVFRMFFRRLQRNSLVKFTRPSIVIFLNYLWGYMPATQLSKDYSVPLGHFMTIFHRVLDSKAAFESENVPGRRVNGILNTENCSSLLLLNLFVPVDDQKDFVRNNPLFFSEMYKKNGITIQLTLLDNKLVSIDGFNFGSGDNFEFAGVKNPPKNLTVREVNILFNEETLNSKLRNFRIHTQSGHSVVDILLHVSRFSILGNGSYRNDPDDILKIFQILFYLSKLFLSDNHC
ncbi:expressed protein [Dictyostelium purpureum]|uniref:Expressed protein n=1 Tax=Dictyostelium purpureum TaxID=5786 RepID=F0ZID0_DICPU|nr:uncharacterized protein DICPUDRAFT_91859 [Dictyostelium purpureum]EGC36305.1 expressed protein [Dictyostelium purpureum]|eukprot:XP_003287183.1 expressed protein [Dictyostelium purpureum]